MVGSPQVGFHALGIEERISTLRTDFQIDSIYSQHQLSSYSKVSLYLGYETFQMLLIG